MTTDDDQAGPKDPLDDGDEAVDHDHDDRARRPRLESILPELLKRGIEKGLEKGLGTLNRTDEALRGVMGDGKLPKEIANHIVGQIDDTKSAMLKIVAREVREFLSATDLASEMRRVLTSLSFEIRTEIRFIPNEAGEGVRPDVKVELPHLKSTRKARKSDPPAPDDKKE